MADGQIVLYDISSKVGNSCWSPNVWKTRCLLNCKGLPYETQWVEIQDVKSTLQAHGVGPESTVALGANVGVEYTLPAVKLPDGRIVMDSAKIAVELEKIQPLPPMHLESGLHEEVQAILRRIAWPLYPEIAPRVRDNFLKEHSRPHWVDSREKLFGMSIDEVHRTKGGEQAWTAARPGLDELADFVKKHKRDNGPFVLGGAVSYADFVIAAFLKSERIVNQAIFERILSGDVALEELWISCSRWLERDR